ncbi:MAG: XrtA/PEP-CTERM system TPR-repeat protein PrsT [Thioalkalivibrio sp.]
MPTVIGLLACVLWLTACGQTSYTAEEMLERAAVFEERGELRASSIELKNLLQAHPDHGEGRWRLGTLLLTMGDGAGALSELERAVSLGWTQPDLPLVLARARLLQREYARVIEELQTWRLPRAQDVVEAHVIRGRARLGLGEVDAAEAEFGAALRSDANHAPALVGLAQVHLTRAEVDAAGRRLDAALEADPGYAQAWDLMGEIHRAEGRLEEAEEAFSRLIEHTAAVPYMGHYKRALTRIAKRDWEGARADYDVLVALSRRAPTTFYVDGLLRFHQQEFDAAVKALEDTLRVRPDYLPALFFAGASHYALGNWQQAESHLTAYVRRRPDVAAAQHLLAALRLRAGQEGDARVLLERVLASNPGDLVALDLMAGIHAAQGDSESSLALLSERVARDPQSVQARTRLATALLESGERERGMQELEAARELAPEAQSLDLAVIVRLLEGGEFQKALEEARAVAVRRPDMAPLHNLMGVALLGLGQGLDAEQEFMTSLRLDPGNFVATRNLASLALRLEGVGAARGIFEQSLEARPDDLRLLMDLAALEARQGDQAQAGKLLEQAILAHPRALQPRLAMARLHLGRNEPRQAVRLLEEIRADHADDLALLEILASAQVAAGQLESATSTLRRLTELAPQSAEVHYRLGLAQRQAGRVLDARRALNRAVELDGQHLRALLALAHLERQSGRFREALSLARRLQEHEAGRADGLLIEGDVQGAEGAHDRALQAYQAAYHERPTTDAALRRFNAARQAGAQADAREALAAHVERYPEDHRARLVLANTFMETGAYALAVEHYERLNRDVPGNAMVLNNLAFAYQRLGDPRSMATAREALALRPGDPRIQDTLGLALLDHGSAQEGLELIETARRSLPDDPVIGYHHARALVSNGRSGEAADILREVLSATGDFSGREQAEDLLREIQ